MKKRLIILGFALLTFFMFTGYTATAKEVLTPEVASIQSLDITDSNTEVSDVLSFEEITAVVSKDFEISLTDAQNLLLQSSSSKSLSSAKAATYRVLSQQFTVTSSYRPTMSFYCQTSESGLYHGILEILSINMIRGYNGISKQFTGNIYVNLENSNRIFYSVNGDFYNNGTTTFDGRINLGIGEHISVGFGISNSSNHYAYRYVESYYNW